MLEVLKQKDQIQVARQSMNQNQESALASPFSKFLWRTRLSKRPPVGDILKSWDVNLTLRFINDKCSRNSSILDLGSFCSEIPVALARKGFENIYGIDLNPRLSAMPFSDRVKYRIGNFMQTPFEGEFFDVVTAISVIEHGYDPERLFSELGRLIKPGGYFIASFDYWPDKINTGNTTFFGLSWLIFSKDDVASMLKIADAHGFRPQGEMRFEAKERPIHCQGFDYTFAWVVLQKRG